MKSIFRSALAGLLLLSALGASPAAAAQPAPPRADDRVADQPLDTLLNPDGALNLTTGFSGSLDATGWQMAAGPDGDPRFVKADVALREAIAPAVTGDEAWDDQFLLGVSYSPDPTSVDVEAIVVSGTDVYIGGQFDRAGDAAANNIAKWDSAAHKWSALGAGLNDAVTAMAARGDDVYVSGYFTRAGVVAAPCLARWNDAAQTWSAVGDALTHQGDTPSLRAIAISDGGDVYVGGIFDQAGDLTVNHIARWDGSQWHALGSGVGGLLVPRVNAIAISGSDVYVGGWFTTPAANIAHWNGATWSELGPGTVGTGGGSPYVSAIAISGSNIYVSGAFDTVMDAGGSRPAGHVAVWSGSLWNTMAGGMQGGFAVGELAVGQDGVYAGGNFTLLTEGNTPANRVARWDGSHWHAVGGTPYNVGGGVDNHVFALAYNGTDHSVYAGGHMDSAGKRAANRIARWGIAADEWYALGNSVNGPVSALVVDGDDVYLGGSFNSAGGIPARGIAVWHGASRTWSTMGRGVSGCVAMNQLGCLPGVYAIALDGNRIYAGGNFTEAGGAPAGGIAVWDKDAQTWSALGDGLSCTGLCVAAALAINISATYGATVGGAFDFAGGPSAHHIARWVQPTWFDMGSGTDATVHALAYRSVNNEIYAGGSFSSPAVHLARWAGGLWSALPGGSPNDTVYALKLSGRSLYAGGAFTDLGGASGDSAAAYDTSNNSWHTLGTGLNGAVYALEYSGRTLYAGGGFTASGITGMNRVARFSGGAWTGFGSGADGPVGALARDAEHLYIGGNFLNAGGKLSTYFGRVRIMQHRYLPLVVK